MILALTLAIVIVQSITTLGEGRKPIEVRYGLGGHWLIYGQRHPYMGVLGRIELAMDRGAALFELGLVHKPGDDDVIVLADGSMAIYFDSGGGRAYLGLGIGLARWEDTGGWDRGIWYQDYSKFIGGKELSLLNLQAFIQVNITFNSWFNPIISAGIWF